MVELNANDPLAYARRAMFLDIKGDHAGAQADLDKALALKPDAIETLFQRARHYKAVKDYPHAIADFTAVLAKNPKAFGALIERLDAAIESGDFTRAIADGETAVAQQPNSPVAHNNACWARATGNRDLDKALSECERALALNPKSAPSIDSRAFVKFRQGKFAEALKDYEAAIKLDPKQAASLYMRGITKLRLGDKAGGEADITAAKALEPDVGERYAKWGVTP